MPNLISQVAPLGQNSDYGLRASAVQYGLCESSGDATAKIAMCNNFTSDYLTEGSIVAIKFSNINSASVDSLTLNVNSTGAKPIKYIYNGALVNLPSADYLKANQVYIFYYDGTNWIILLSNDTNDVSSLDVTNSNPSLQWNTTSIVGSVNGTELTVTMPESPVFVVNFDWDGLNTITCDKTYTQISNALINNKNVIGLIKTNNITIDNQTGDFEGTCGYIALNCGNLGKNNEEENVINFWAFVSTTEESSSSSNSTVGTAVVGTATVGSENTLPA